MKTRTNLRLLSWTARLVIALTMALAWSPSLFASEPCEKDGQVIPRPVCDFDTFYGNPPRQLPNGWEPFVLSGEVTYMQDVDTFWGAPALRMWNNGGTFKAGIYTRVDATPGAGYRASISWGAPNAPDAFGRQLGIDPTGGTDPNAATVVWGAMHWGPGRILNYTNGQGPNIDVRARAVADTVTVFFMVDHPHSTGDNLIFVDAVALYPDESAPALEPTPAPTEPVQIARTDPDPTATQTPIPMPTATYTPTPTEVPTETATPTPSPTASATPTATPTATPSPTWTPWPSATPEPPVQANTGLFVPTSLAGDDIPLAQLQALAGRTGRTGLLLVGLISLGSAGLFGGSLWWLRRR